MNPPDYGKVPAQYESERAVPDYSSFLTALTAVKREVEAIGPNLDAALQLIAERSLGFLRASGAAIALARGAEMTCLARAGDDAPPLGARLQVGSGFSGECVRAGRLLRCDDCESDPRVDQERCRAGHHLRVHGVRGQNALERACNPPSGATDCAVSDKSFRPRSA